jgi:catechol 2,3-dioxygenase-like lactoylglutathione lyase family enzyme
MTPADTTSIAPFFIVRDLQSAHSFYRDLLGFEIIFEGPTGDPFFGVVRRGGAMIMLKDVGEAPLPNCQRELPPVGTLT